MNALKSFKLSLFGMKLTKSTIVAAIYSFLLPASADVLLAFWDFNDEAVTDPLVNTPFTFTPNAGNQLTAELSMVLADTSSSNTFGVRAEGTTVNDIHNDPQVAGNSFAFGRGWRSENATASIAFDATSISLPIEMTFAINRIATQAVDQYQASYSINGGDDFTDLGSAVSITQGSWELHTINFGTALSGSSDAIVRLTFLGGTTNWSADHRTNLDNIALTAIPEPGTLALVGIALGSLLLFRRKS